MKKVLVIFGMAFMGIAALEMSDVKQVSAYTQVSEFATSSATVTGVQCSTSTPTSITAIPGVRVGARILNLDATANVYIGFNANISTYTVSMTTNTGVNIGEKIVPGGNATYNVGRAIPIYCKSDSTSSTWISVMQLAQ